MITTYGTDFGVASTTFRRTTAPGKIGRQMQTWLRTPEGWLLMYHGVRSTASGAIYRLGLALLDLDNPSRVIYRSDEWVLQPEEDYGLGQFSSWLAARRFHVSYLWM